MSYVGIWRPVNDQIVQASRDSQREIIGLLLGRLENGTIIIEDSITGEFLAEPNRVTLLSNTLAKIADDILSRRIKGNIIGWYHSHTESGLTFSETDIETQKKLQQFSSLITAMVIDAKTGDMGCFRVDTQTGRSIRIPDVNVRIFEEQTGATPPETKAGTQVPVTSTIGMRQLPAERRLPTKVMIFSIILVALLASLSLLGFIFYGGLPRVAAISIRHSPVLSATIGTPVEIKAIVNGTVRNVTLLYSVSGTTSFTEVAMNSSLPGQYSYVIPGEGVARNVVYYIRAIDVSGNEVRTETYTIPVADFAFSTNELALTVYRDSSTSTTLDLLYMNAFNNPVSLSTTDTPQGLTVIFTPNPTTLAETQVTVNVAADTRTPSGTFSLALIGTYSPLGGSAVTRQLTAKITVADFDLQVTPSSVLISAGTTASFTLALTIQQGFVDPVQVTVQGLPQGAAYELASGGSTMILGGSGTTTITLRITTTLSVRPGTYALTISASGGGVVHRQIVQVTVR